jgi:hypothetical protein
MKIGDNWTCPYCLHAQVVSETHFKSSVHKLDCAGWEHGIPALEKVAIVCANAKCKKLDLYAALWKLKLEHGSFGALIPDKRIESFQLLPKSFAKPQPNYVPKNIRDDYYEACAIRDLSPKAAATLIRRCIQGIIRDFCGIRKGRLVDEINELRNLIDENKAPQGVTEDMVEAIDHVRHLGNIGAHMEKDINVIVDVDPDEAQKLIELAEILFAEWYIARQRRADKLAKIGVLSAEKKAVQKQKQLPPPVIKGSESKSEEQ